MSIWSLLGGTGVCNEYGPITAASQVGPSFTCGIDTKGAWVEITPALAYTTAGILLMTESWSAGAQRVALDIGIGAAASEVAKLENILFHGSNKSQQYFSIVLPAGARVAVRAQATTAALTARCGFWAVPENAGMQGLHRWTTYGVNVSSATAGTLVDAGGTAHTKSAWVQLVASTTAPTRLLHILYAGETLTGNTGANGLVDIGRGGSGNEVVIVPNVAFRLDTAATTGWALGPFPANVPAASRLAVRHQSASTVVASARNMHWGILAGG